MEISKKKIANCTSHQVHKVKKIYTMRIKATFDKLYGEIREREKVVRELIGIKKEHFLNGEGWQFSHILMSK